MEKKADFHSLSRKAKVQYVWDYYKWPIAAAIAALCFVIYLIYHYATYRDPLLNVIMMNCNDSITADSKGFDEFLEACGYDPKEDSVSLTSSLQLSDGEYSTSYNDTQVLTLMLAAGGQDLFFGTGDEYLDYADQGALMDLSTVLSDELLDRNHLQIDGTTETVMNSAPLEEKLKAFNFNVLTINGHDYDQIESAIKAFHAENDKPTCIILDTVKGTGVSFMTNSVDWHGKGPNDEEYAVAMQELNAAYAALEQEDK